MITKFMTSLRSFLASLTRPYPARDWFVVLCVVLVAFLGSVLFAGYLLVGIRSGGIIRPTESEGPPQPAVTKGDIEKVLEAYRARRVNFQARNLPVQTLKDPR